MERNGDPGTVGMDGMYGSRYPNEGVAPPDEGAHLGEAEAPPPGGRGARFAPHVRGALAPLADR